MKKAFTKKDIKALVKNMSEDEALDICWMIDDINRGSSDVSSTIEYGGFNVRAAQLLVIFAAIQAAGDREFCHLDEIESEVATRLGTTPRLVRKALLTTKLDTRLSTRYFGKEVTVYDRMGLNTFSVD